MGSIAGKICPKCKHERTELDTGPDWRCPSCGVAYAKAAEAAAAPASVQVAPPPRIEPARPSAAADEMMGFGEAIKTCFAKFLDFSGRATRAEFWWFVLFYFLVMFAVSFLGKALGFIAVVVFLLPMLSVQVRRLHDVGRSGWWILIGFVPIIGTLLLLYWAVKGSDGTNDWG